eukprot:6129-Heterococcus_DN1.PRE.1
MLPRLDLHTHIYKHTYQTSGASAAVVIMRVIVRSSIYAIIVSDTSGYLIELARLLKVWTSVATLPELIVSAGPPTAEIFFQVRSFSTYRPSPIKLSRDMYCCCVVQHSIQQQQGNAAVSTQTG